MAKQTSAAVDFKGYRKGIALHYAGDGVPGDHPCPYVAGGAVFLLQAEVGVDERGKEAPR